MSTVKVKYVGRKPVKTDNVAGSGIVWTGPGDVQEVTPEVWVKLSKHEGVWELVSDEPEKKPEAEDTKPAEWLTLDAEALHAYAVAHELKIDKRLKDADKIRAAIDALTP